MFLENNKNTIFSMKRQKSKSNTLASFSGKLICLSAFDKNNQHSRSLHSFLASSFHPSSPHIHFPHPSTPPSKHSIHPPIKTSHPPLNHPSNSPTSPPITSNPPTSPHANPIPSHSPPTCSSCTAACRLRLPMRILLNNSSNESTPALLNLASVVVVIVWL